MANRDEKNATDEAKEMVKEAVSSASGEDHMGNEGKSDKTKARGNEEEPARKK